MRASITRVTTGRSTRFTEPICSTSKAFSAARFTAAIRSFNFVGDERNKSYAQVSTGLGRDGLSLTEFLSTGTRYSLGSGQDFARRG